MKEKRKRFIQIFSLMLLMLFVASASYAYFIAQVGNSSNTDILVTTSTVDTLSFETGEAISISATQDNFGTGDGNLSDSTYATATLVANNDTNSATSNYYLYLKIDSNEYNYTTSDSTPELILKVTDPNGNEVTSLSGLTYTTVTNANGEEVSGFDITRKIGLITIASNYTITSTGINTQEWNIEVIYINLSTNQASNGGASFSAYMVIEGSAFGNTLQSIGWGYNEEIWAYKSSITKIVFDDTGSTIDDYDQVYVCTYDGNEVYNFDNKSINGVTESSCNTVYKITDDSYTVYYDDSYTSLITDVGEAVWDNDDEVCKTSDGNEVISWYYGNSIEENNCSGTVYSYSGKYYLGIEYVGSGTGEWKDAIFDISYNSDESILAYLVNNGNDTYTTYIVSDLPIVASSLYCYFQSFTLLEEIEGLDKLITSNVTGMSYMFQNCSSLTSLDLSNFDTSSVKDIGRMFYGCSSLTSLDLSSFDTSSATSMAELFRDCISLESLNISNFDTSNVTTMYRMFSNCSNLISLDVRNFDTSSVTIMEDMFIGCSNLTSLDVSNFNTSKVTTMYRMFCNCSSLTSLDLSNFDTSNVTTMASMFQNCKNLTDLNISGFNTSKVTTMASMFSSCDNLESLDLTHFDTSNVKNMSGMFYSCDNLVSVDVSNFNTSNVTTMASMFSMSPKLISLDLSSFDTTNVTDISYMFYYCTRLTNINLSNADFSNVETYDGMFSGNNSSITITVKNSSAYDFITVRLSEYNGGTVVIA